MGRQAFRLWSLAALISALAVPARAGVERWTPFGPPLGSLTSLIMDAEGNLYAAAVESSVYKSADRGQTWSWSGTGTGNEQVQALVFDLDDDELYAAGRNRLFRSTDAGAHWNPVAPVPPQTDIGEPSLLALVPGEPDTLFLTRGARLYRSRDEGASWTLQETAPALILSLLIDPQNPQSVFLGTDWPGGRLLHSTDGGATWAAAVNGYPGEFNDGVQELAAASTTPATLFAISAQRLFRSSDAGATWQKIPVPTPFLPDPDSGYTASIAVVPGSHPRIYAFQQHVSGPSIHALYVSEDLGDTWTLVATETRGARLRVQPATHELYAFALDGVGLTDNGGADWHFAPLGTQACGAQITREPPPRLRFVGARTYAIVGGRLWISRAGGRTWSALGRDLIDQCLKIRDITFGEGSLWAAVDRGVYRSQNGGATWTPSLGPFDVNNYYPFFSVVFAGPHTLLANGAGVWRSGDGGASWQRTLEGVAIHDEFEEPEFARYVYRLEADPVRPRFVYAGAVEMGDRHPLQILPYVYQSQDNGRTWQRLAEGTDLVALDPHRPATLYLATGSGLLRSRDRGLHWTPISDFIVLRDVYANSDLEADPFDPRVLYAARKDGVWRSVDGGVTWDPLRAGLGNRPAFEIFPDPRRPGRLFVGSNGLFEGRFPLPE